jgi:hypothetical protein
MNGLCLHLNCDTRYFKNFKAQERVNHEDFSAVITRIEDVIFVQQYEGVVLGFFNQKIIAPKLTVYQPRQLSIEVEQYL